MQKSYTNEEEISQKSLFVPVIIVIVVALFGIGFYNFSNELKIKKEMDLLSFHYKNIKEAYWAYSNVNYEMKNKKQLNEARKTLLSQSVNMESKKQIQLLRKGYDELEQLYDAYKNLDLLINLLERKTIASKTDILLGAEKHEKIIDRSEKILGNEIIPLLDGYFKQYEIKEFPLRKKQTTNL